MSYDAPLPQITWPPRPRPLAMIIAYVCHGRLGLMRFARLRQMAMATGAPL